ncbi:MAG: CHAD domain-containing protein [Rubellimicrobium sp.]|nr:CHAD domain-containing protein [Rubellimicrobium sp.]
MAPRRHAPDHSACDSLRRACRTAAAEALARLDGPDSSGRSSVHEVRKRIKRMRGLLQLVRPGFEDYARENAALRDSDVTLATLDSLPGAAAAFPALHAALTARSAALRTEEETGAIVRKARAALKAFRKRAKAWHLRDKGVRTLAAGIAGSHDRARRGLAAVRDDPTPARLHDWRKSVRYMQYQLRFLRPLWPELAAPRLSAAGDLGEVLGLFNDLDVLSARAAAADLPEAERAALSGAIAARQSDLLARALPLGERLCAGPGKAQAAIWTDLWKQRQDGG